jgi:ABC-type nitrate/sulfonate/bicarbonate transport system substrate-binding protein
MGTKPAVGPRVLTLFIALMWASLAAAADSKVLNIGWTGGTAWTALPDRIASERGFFEKEGLKFATFNSRAPT